MIDATKDVSEKTNEANDRYTSELLEFKEFNTFIPTLEDEVIGLEFLLAEPGSSDGLVEPFLGVSSAKLQKCFGTEEKQNHKNISNDTKYPFHTSRRDEQYHWEDNNGHMQGTDEGILQEMNNLPSICEDYLFDCKLAGEVSMLDCDLYNVPFINQPNEFTSENKKECNGYKGNYCKGSEKTVDEPMTMYSDLTAKIGRFCQSSASLLNEKVIPKVISLGKEELLCDSIVTLSSMVSDGGLHLAENGVCFTQKRSRKRPLRYIDEYSKYHSIHTNNKRSGGLSKSTREKTAQTPYLDYVNNVNERKTLQYIEYPSEPIQVPFGPSVLKECSRRKTFSSRDYDPEVYNNKIVKFSEGSTNTELSFTPSQDDRSNSCDLEEVTKDKSGRKHNKYWSEYEIAKLIEGVATYGVGRWTDIKRGLFPPSTRRTSVDLKDKWRNLLKACRAHLHSAHEGRKVAHQQIKQSVLRRVKELDAMHPYPKIPSRKNPLLVRC